ncbi:MAG: two-component system response regulator AtoC [Myxococcota bacterium]
MARILVAEDEPGLRSFVAGALELSGHDVVAAEDGGVAWRLANQSAFDLVITDLKMPRLDGLTLLRKLKATQPEVQVVVMTAHGGVQSAVEAMKLGAFDYLAKPLAGPSELRLLVTRALEHRRLSDRAEVVRTAQAAPPLTYGAPAMVPVVRALEKVARTPATVLLLGESGTGKEVSARAVHSWSPRADGPFVAVNCAALSASLLESELFGHEKGAFTGAAERRRGKLELAAGGTFFLDEIGELALDLQAKLLRVLQERTFERVGGNTTIQADVRWIAATNRDLREMISAGTFREDLYHRVAVFPIHLPPLRERIDDLIPLAEALLTRIGPEVAGRQLRLDSDAERALLNYPWTGNIRELSNALERAAILVDGDTVRAADLWLEAARPTARPTAGDAPTGWAPTMEAAERTAIEAALRLHDGNRRQAATHLGIGLRTLYDKLKKYGL